MSKQKAPDVPQQKQEISPENACDEGDTRRSVIASSIITTQAEIARQQEAIRQMSAENEKLKKEIAAVTGEPYDYIKADKHAALRGEVSALERRYQFEKMKLNELTKQYQIARIDFMQCRRIKGGVNAEMENAQAVQRQLEILENRLDQALAKFNDAVSYNKELRDHIDLIRGERRVFQRVHKRLEDDLRSKKRIMSERIEQSNKDLDERDNNLRQVEQLKKALKEQKEEYDAVVRNLDVSMMEINNLREEHQRLQLDYETRAYDCGAVAESLSATTTNNNGTLPLGNQQDEVDDGSEKGSAADVESDLLNIPAQLSQFAPDGDLTKLVEHYEQLGKSNFSLYKYINELTTGREEMEREIRTLRKAITEELANEAQQRRLIKDLEDRLAETEEVLERIRASGAVHNEVLASVRSATEEVFKELGCSTEDARRLLGSERCTESVHLQFLGLIEERALGIMCSYRMHLRRSALFRDKEWEGDKTSLQDGTGILGVDASACSGGTLREETTEVSPASAEIAGAGGEVPGESVKGTVATADNMYVDEQEVEELLKQAAAEGILSFISVKKGASASQFVRQACLPSVHFCGDDGVEVMEDHDGDPVVSHEELRLQVQHRLVTKRMRDERAQRRKREVKDQHPSLQTAPRRK
ncbi:hypothetical protein ERJ75_001648100 [Trypanosoma vivax]|uniref:ODAD1 central coiled coil region domain-containing protein n=1 Tax=Trypanosoma vivax (strain Y486) TaxID=1055687 RepID=G0U9C1_TRYVY|nr:hypothetical protein TRVL_03986 [Trypanosoma vivax]KAH8604924.1 hypothetical protein ERJ75_001648100 [Trypanosoma vivax]CCC54206.1 conserved hypothetical protein [Trypanosoma vivax Y486]